ncbi:hypothetical protein [Streptomyces sp. NBC_00842]|uniref:hypothetical protein n=1 Tax=unclassified Streptomyces TaxID=2593676 RepID=UPI00386E342B
MSGPVAKTGVGRPRDVLHRHPRNQPSIGRAAGRHSLGLRRLAVAEAVRGSYGQALGAIRRRCGDVLGKRQLARLFVTAATDIDAFYRSRILVPCTRDMPLVIQADGKGIVMRPEALREATRRKAEKTAAQGRRGRRHLLRLPHRTRA